MRISDWSSDVCSSDLDLHLEGLVEDGGEVPVPRPISELQTDPDFANGVWAVVDVDTSRFDGRAEKINITVPRRVLTQIDNYAKAHGATRSGFLVEAARRAMADRKSTRLNSSH